MLDSDVLVLENSLYNSSVWTMRQSDGIKKPIVNYKKLDKTIFPITSVCDMTHWYNKI